MNQNILSAVDNFVKRVDFLDPIIDWAGIHFIPKTVAKAACCPPSCGCCVCATFCGSHCNCFTTATGHQDVTWRTKRYVGPHGNCNNYSTCQDCGCTSLVLPGPCP